MSEGTYGKFAIFGSSAGGGVSTLIHPPTPFCLSPRPLLQERESLPILGEGRGLSAVSIRPQFLPQAIVQQAVGQFIARVESSSWAT